MLRSSDDGGRTWSAARPLPDGVVGPTKNKPITLADGTLLAPASSEDFGWRVHLERSGDRGVTWTRTAPLADPHDLEGIQPAILRHPGGRLQLLCRTRSGRIATSWSDDAGRTWSALDATALPNPNSGIDALTLADGRHLVVYNPSASDRTPLAVALSADGRDWHQVATLESGAGEFSYPAVIQSRDGLVHITHTWKRERIAHIVLDPARLR
jgi:predicted neuraminidase